MGFSSNIYNFYVSTLISIVLLNFMDSVSGQGYSLNDNFQESKEPAAPNCNVMAEISAPTYYDYNNRPKENQNPNTQPYNSTPNSYSNINPATSSPYPYPGTNLEQIPKLQYNPNPEPSFTPNNQNQIPKLQYNPNPGSYLTPNNPKQIPTLQYNTNPEPFYYTPNNPGQIPKLQYNPNPEPSLTPNNPGQIPKLQYNPNPEPSLTPNNPRQMPLNNPTQNNQNYPQPPIYQKPYVPNSNLPNKYPVEPLRNEDDIGADSYKQPEPKNNLQSNYPNPSIQETSPDVLMQLLTQLNNKVKELEETQKSLNKNIDELQEKLSKKIPEKINSTTIALTENKIEESIEGWKELKENIDSPQELQNLTNNIVSNACDQMAKPQIVMDFVHQLPDTSTSIKASAYNTIANKMENSEDLQSQMYWREMTPYCQQVAQDIGTNSPTTIKMLNLQDQMRLISAQPIRQCTGFIEQKQFQPAIMSWTNMTYDIPDNDENNTNQLNKNMEKIITRAYDGNIDNIQNVFHFIIILPESQNQYREVAYNCLLKEMNSNGHYFDPNTRSGKSQDQQQQQQQLTYSY